MKPVPSLLRTLVLGFSVASLLSACGGGDEEARDMTLPTVSTSFPAADASVQISRISVLGTAADDKALKSVVVEVNGVENPATLSAASFEAEILLKPGSNTYTVVATDTAGNQKKLQGTVYFGRRVAAAGSHSGVIANGKLYTWGRNNFGQTGLGYASTLAANPAVHPLAPVLVNAPATFVSLAFNQNQSVALDQNGKLWSWGDDSNGQLGRGEPALCTATLQCRLDIGQVAGLDHVLSVSSGYGHILALRDDGTAWGFGLNTHGQLGDGTSTSRNTPVQVKWAEAYAGTVGTLIQLSASSASSYALDNKGQVWAWGRNQSANLGQGTTSASTVVQSTPLRVPMPDGAKIVSIASGKDHVLALTKAGKVYAWGLNASSQVGFNGYKYKDTAQAWPTPVTSPRSLPAMDSSPAVEVYANGNTSYVRRANGKVYPWGMHGATEGTGATIYANLDEPEDRLASLESIVDMSVGALHQVALRNDGKLFSWGWSFEGALGGGATALNTWMYNVPLTPVLP